MITDGIGNSHVTFQTYDECAESLACTSIGLNKTTGSFFVGGYSAGTITVPGLGSFSLGGSTQSFVLKTFNNLTAEWLTQIRSPSVVWLRAISTDCTGYVYAVGTFTGASITIGSLTVPSAGASAGDCFVAKIDSDGQAQYIKVGADMHPGIRGRINE